MKGSKMMKRMVVLALVAALLLAILPASALAASYLEATGDRVSEIPFTKLLIGAAALSHEGLLTRRPEEFKRFFPKLRCVGPKSPAGKVRS